jgi:predicted secreted protein
MVQDGTKDQSLDQPKTIELCVGQSYDLRLSGHGTAGYVWTHKIEAEREKIIEVEEKPTHVKDSQTTRSTTYSVDRIFTIHAVSSGRAKVRFTESRPWEKDKPPLNEHSIEVSVLNLNID